ncbi:hypothetical protein GCM10011316_27260 [Roseibium aquae]|uniref:Uncharacterized protein n=1 Tax=Roseibium aquae TaxID=1323746 RepID=A0A916X1H0_9HYPH|nr:hypothetical protein [Roseibium aquae]GGB53776.1 hypothetical protein GCM10011316_27260 [Roseibium aquae]
MREEKRGPSTALESQKCDETCRAAIVSALKQFTTEMQLIDVVDLIAFIRTDQHANIEDLIKSSAELFFKPDTLRYSMAAAVDLSWETMPAVSLDLEFFNKGVWIYFTLVLRHPDNAVNVTYIEFSGSSGAGSSGASETMSVRLIEALKDARLSRQR